MTGTFPRKRRRGSIMPVVAILLVAMCGFTALSVEIATIASVKLACQAAADSGALAGARTLDGSTTSKTSQATSNAQSAAAGNSALGINASTGKLGTIPFAASEVAVTNGTYHYNTSTQTFAPAYTLATGETYNLTQVVAQRAVKNSFFSVDAGSNASAVNQIITASAVATHRPRDISVIFDFSGSMNDESDLWNCDSYYGPYYGISNNTDTRVPTFGHYSSSSAGLVSTSTSPGGQCNITIPISGMPAEVDSFIQSGPSVSPTAAGFTAASTSYGSAPAGDIPLLSNLSPTGSATQTLNQVFGSNNTTTITVAPITPVVYNTLWNPDYFENGDAPPPGALISQAINNSPNAGYDLVYQYLASAAGWPAAPSGRTPLGTVGFSGYTQGPAYWGKTFFIWPPDPRPLKDWRQLYFIDIHGNGNIDNTELWVSSPQSPYGNYWKFPYEPFSGTLNYRINYKAILAWIKTIGVNPFPLQLRAGRISYYSYIPTDVPASAYDPTQLNSAITDPSQRFWKEYIDYCLGVWRDPFGNVWPPGYQACSMGPDFAWGTVQISGKPSGSTSLGQKLAYMNYNDNPARPRHRMWFGPMTMLQFISDTGLSPGTARDISTYSTKLGITSVLQDIQVNHPNDSVAMILYNRPQYTGEPSIGEFNQAQYNLNRNYSAMINSLWYPPNSTTTADVTPWDANGSQTPSADNDFVSNTATQHGLMLAYNQFSGASALQSAAVGGLGRVGAQRLVILETDGVANVNTNASFTSNSTNSYYNILPGQSITAGNYDANATMQVAQAICNTATGTAGSANSAVSNPGLPGFATASRPVLIHTIAFGNVFQIPSSTQTGAVSLLQGISQIGGTTFPSSASDATNGYKWCIGPLSTRVQLLQQAFAKVLDDGQAISLIR